MAWRGSGIWQWTGRGTECTPLLLKQTHNLNKALHAQTTLTQVYMPLEHKRNLKISPQAAVTESTTEN